MYKKPLYCDTSAAGIPETVKKNLIQRKSLWSLREWQTARLDTFKKIGLQVRRLSMSCSDCAKPAYNSNDDDCCKDCCNDNVCAMIETALVVLPDGAPPSDAVVTSISFSNITFAGSGITSTIFQVTAIGLLIVPPPGTRCVRLIVSTTEAVPDVSPNILNSTFSIPIPPGSSIKNKRCPNSAPALPAPMPDPGIYILTLPPLFDWTSHIVTLMYWR